MEIFPFQYIISNKKVDSLMKNGEIVYHNNLNIQIHASNRDHLICKEDVIFFGECFDSGNPKFSNKEVVDSLLHLNIEQKIKKLNKLTGFFTFLFFSNDDIYVFNDTAGQLETYISNENDELYIAAQPTLIKNGKNIADEKAPPYITDRKINIFSKTPFKHIIKLIPNFYYDVKEKKLTRFYPENPLPILDNVQVAKEALSVLETSMESMSYRKNMSLAVTAGWDSRILFAASLKSADRIHYFVLNHKTEDGKQDVKIAGEITDAFSKELRVIDYDLSPIQTEENDVNLWKDDVKGRKMAHLMNIHFPDRYLINGNISEVARNFYDPLPHHLSLKDLCCILGLRDGTYEREAVNEWKNTLPHNIHLLDALYWEHKMPNWAGSSKSVSNIHNMVMSPFNNRYLLNLLLSTKRKDRDKYFHKIYELMLKNVGENLAKIPINPTRKHHQIEMMKKAGVYKIYRTVFFRLRKLKF